MRKLIINSIIIFIVLIASYANAQQDTSADKDRVEKNTAPFSMDYFSKKNTFLVFTTSFDKSGLVIDEKSSIEEVNGKMPYPSGRLNIKVLNRRGEQILDYFMQDPMQVRSCDEKESRIIQIEKGIIQLPLPMSREIATIVLAREDKTISRLDVQAVIEKYWKERGDQR